jgi:cell division protein ZapA (FtsZ GTPase activity inhibitor)
MEESVNRVRVVIAGEEFHIRGSAPADTVNRISGYVNEKISEAGKGMTSKERYSQAILAAVNITAELFDAQQKLEESKNRCDQFIFKAKELNEKLESLAK